MTRRTSDEFERAFAFGPSPHRVVRAPRRTGEVAQRGRRVGSLFTSRANPLMRIELRPLQDLRREDNADAVEITIDTGVGGGGGQPLLVDGREREKLSFTVVGNWELQALLDGFEQVAKDLRCYRKATRAERKR